MQASLTKNAQFLHSFAAQNVRDARGSVSSATTKGPPPRRDLHPGLKDPPIVVGPGDQRRKMVVTDRVELRLSARMRTCRSAGSTPRRGAASLPSRLCQKNRSVSRFAVFGCLCAASRLFVALVALVALVARFRCREHVVAAEHPHPLVKEYNIVVSNVLLQFH